jgi:hypothetical protein
MRLGRPSRLLAAAAARSDVSNNTSRRNGRLNGLSLRSSAHHSCRLALDRTELRRDLILDIAKNG